jgi:hypothetical protein
MQTLTITVSLQNTLAFASTSLGRTQHHQAGWPPRRTIHALIGYRRTLTRLKWGKLPLFHDTVKV